MGEAISIRQGQSISAFAPRSFDELHQFAKLAAASDLVPKDYLDKPGNILIACIMGAELGLAPMQSLQNIAVINGRPSVWGDALLALCQAHPSFVDCVETDDGATATCVVTRKGRQPITRTFSTEDAKRANLAGKGPWSSYPGRMRQMRARGFALRDAFADVLRGIISAEEAQDMPSMVVTVREPERATEVITEPEKAPPALPQPTEPFRFKTGEHAGESIEAVPTDYLQRLGKHKLNQAMRARVDAEMERRNSSEYIAEQLRKSLPANESSNDDLPEEWGGTPSFLYGDLTGEPLSGASLQTLLDYDAAELGPRIEELSLFKDAKNVAEHKTLVSHREKVGALIAKLEKAATEGKA